MRPLLPVVLALAACPAATPPASPPQKDVALVINGRAITEAEVGLRMRARGPGKPQIPREEAVEQLILLELQAQRAERLGLQNDPAFLAEMELVAARGRDARRSRLARAFRLGSLGQPPSVSEEEARQWYTAHADRVRTQLILKRLTARTASEATAARERIEAGAPFDEVAAGFPGDAVDVGPLGFDAIPEAWWKALEGATPGTVTGVVDAGGERFFVLQLVERRLLPEPAFAEVRGRIEGQLQARALELRMRGLEEELKSGATIERRAAPSAPPRSPSDEGD